MKNLITALIVLFVVSCKEKEATTLSSQNIVDQSITVSGGELYQRSNISFKFRDRKYMSEIKDNKKVLQRSTKNDSAIILDILGRTGFTRFVNDSVIHLPDSMANSYSNSVNSVHYFANLPYGLNDTAVNKEFLGEIRIKDSDYYKLKVTFDQEDGGDDFDDTYIYWFNKKTFKPDYLAYEFHVNGGGLRFREAYNERYVGGIRFVNYYNFKPKDENTSIFDIDSLYLKEDLELLSKIELEDILVTQ